MKFHYQARTIDGEVKTGIVEASSEEAALDLLQRYELYVTYLKEAKTPIFARELKLFRKISIKDIVLFTRQLSMMFSSKVPLVEALRALANQTTNLELKEKILEISKEVEGGVALSKALSRYPKIFSQFYISMVKAGEASGKLAESFNYLADHLEREYNIAGKIKGALIYPILVIVVSIFVVSLMIFFVIPKLRQVFLEGEMKIPTTTLLIFNIADFIKKSAPFLIFGLFLLIFLIYRFYKTEKGKKILDNLFLKLPIIGNFLKISILSQFAENLSTLITGGLMISQALDLTGDIIGNSLYKKAIFTARDEVRKGVPISQILSLFPEIFPPMFIQVISVGEKTGTLDTSLMQIANFYQKEVERTVNNILTILEPVLIIFLGIVVAFLALAVLMPIYNMTAAF